MLFDIGAYVVTVHAVAITDREEVQAQLAQHVGHEHVGVLVWLIWIAGLVADGCGEGELGDAIEAFA